MASIEKRKLKRGVSYAVVFYLDGKKRKIYLGKEYKYRDAQEVRLAVEDYVACRKTGNRLSRSTELLFQEAPDDLKSRLGCLGVGGTRSQITLEGAWNAFLESKKIILKENTYRSYVGSYERLKGVLGGSTLVSNITDIDAENAKLFLLSQKSRATVFVTLNTFRMFFNWLVKRGDLPYNVFSDVKTRNSANKERQYYLSMDEANKILAFMPNKEYRLLFACWRFAGMRKMEPFVLKPNAFDMEKRIVTIQSPKTEAKGKPFRRAPIIDPLYNVLREGHEYPFFPNLAKKEPYRVFLAELVRNGYSVYPRLIQNLRASFENDLVASGLPSHVVADWVGHTVDVQERHYLQVSAEYFDRAIKSVG